jgi:hypothetical protein
MSTLFKTEAELKDYLSTTSGFKLSQLQPSFNRALTRYLREALGLVQLTALSQAYDAGTLDAASTALLDAVRTALVAFAAGYYANGAGVQLGATGPVQSESATLKPAGRVALADMGEANEAAGFEALEALFELLEDNRADYPLWASSDACTVLHGQFLATATEFDKLVFINRSRRRFLELQPTMRDIERLVLGPLMGAPLVQELRAQLTAATVTVLNIELLSYVRPVVANLAIRDDEDRQATGAAYLAELREFLYERADDYPLFKTSTAYQPAIPVLLQQDASWGFYAPM